jgi:integrase
MAHIERHHRRPCDRDGCHHGFARHGKSAKGQCTVEGCTCRRWIAAEGDRETLRARWRDPAGKERSKTFTRKLDADRFLVSVEDSKLRGAYVDPAAGRVPFGQWADEWFETTVALQPSTRKDYRNLLRNHVRPAFGDLSLAAANDTLLIRKWLARMQAAGLGTKRVRKAHAVLRLILESAVEGKRLATNAAAGMKRLPKVERQEMHFLDARQIEALAEAIRVPYRVLIRFAAYSGVRPAELAALQVRRLDLLHGKARVLVASTEVDGRLETGPTKTHEHRTVRLPRFLCDELGAYLAARAHKPEDLVFGAPQGGPLREGNFMRRHFRPAVAAANARRLEEARPDERPALLPEGLRMYDLRHSCASLLIAQGASVKAVQKQLGHKSATMTLDTYGHLWPDETERLVERMDQAHEAAILERSRTLRGPTVVPLGETRR